MHTSLMSISVGAILLPAAYHFMEDTEGDIETSATQSGHILLMSHGVRTRIVSASLHLSTCNYGAGVHRATLQCGHSIPSASPYLNHFLQSIPHTLYSSSGRTSICITTVTTSKVNPCRCKFELQCQKRLRYSNTRENVLRRRFLNRSVAQTWAWAIGLKKNYFLPPTNRNWLSTSVPRIPALKRMNHIRAQQSDLLLPVWYHWLAKIHSWATCLATQLF